MSVLFCKLHAIYLCQQYSCCLLFVINSGQSRVLISEFCNIQKIFTIQIVVISI